MFRDLIKSVLRQASHSKHAMNDHEDLVLWARRRIASDFPNPERKDCPDAESLANLINRNQFPSPALKAHILSCSNCFADYRILIAQRHERATVVHSSAAAGPARLLERRAIFALALLLMIVSIAGLIAWLRRDNSQTYVRQVTVAPASPLVATPTPPTSSDATNRRVAEPAPHEALIVNRLNIDLEKLQQSREASNNSAREIQFKHGINEVVIKLPHDSPNGTYRIMLTDSFGKQRLASVVKLSAGRTIRTKINVTSFVVGGYLLCVTSKGETPDCVSARLGGR